ncbi:MAG: GTP 3',8-cyclase MoaA [bacterium]
MRDGFEREVNYLRISVTDLCNLRCLYCMPPEGVKKLRHSDILSFEEIARIVRCSVSLGFRKFRLTGGEPLVRRGILDLVGMLSEVEGVEDLSITTNGILLKDFLPALKERGLMRINLSLDTLRPERFRKITRRGELRDVLDSIEAVFAVGYDRLKINVVLMRGENDDEVADFARMTMDRPIHVRFIEFMPEGDHCPPQGDLYISASEIMPRIRSLGPLRELGRESPSDPATLYKLEGSVGTIGFISPMSSPFCGTCNRLRLTADGRLLPCLMADSAVDVKAILRSGGSDEDIQDALRRAIYAKPRAHGGARHFSMNQVGG